MSLMRIVLPVLSTSMLMAASGESIYQTKCASCHGKMAEKKALGHSNVIKGMPVDQFVKLTKAFATGEKKAIPIAKIVKKQFIDGYSDEEIRSVAEYVNKL
ncbi:c-type cytochrome [Sulfurovum sp. XGS-02]|uniref:c-type cytochrome n=1 Tax=Sulfurovum sp. XGS-02 TaxID=2925411 RepID=UPI002057F6E5|nr:c-type cytochrome [Sulfurovum sp. XGS-02]UPT76575.1 c-type cytochrome [Sulfurovum sp. XGS-02]